MYQRAYPLFLRSITPLHVGSGNDLGLIDLPIQRERHTGFPKIEGSSLKGGLRENFEMWQKNSTFSVRVGNREIKGSELKEAIELVFGPEDAGSDGYMGAVSFTDARLLFYPVRSIRGVFAYLTCPYVLQRLEDDLQLVAQDIQEILFLKEKGKANLVSTACALLVGEGQIVLEEFPFPVEKNDKLDSWAKKIEKQLNLGNGWLAQRIVVISDDDFADFVKNSTEVVTRIRIVPETGTVKEGALFNEEYLPAETVLYSLAYIGKVRRNKNSTSKVFGNSSDEEKQIGEFLENGLPRVMQLGANATIGKGIVKINLIAGGR